MRLVPLILLLCSITLAKKKKHVQRVKRLLIGIGSIASIVRNGGIGKNLQLASQQIAIRGLPYASNYNTLYNSYTQPENNVLVSTGTAPSLIFTNNDGTITISSGSSSSGTIWSRLFGKPPANPKIILGKTVAPASALVPLVAVDNPLTVPVEQQYPVQYASQKFLSVDHPVPVFSESALLSQTPVLHHPGVSIVQPPVLVGDSLFQPTLSIW